MTKSAFITFIAILSSSFLFAQPVNKTATDAFVLARMAAKFHVQPRPLDDHLSSDFFDLLLDELDAHRSFFTSQDIATLQQFRYQLDDQVRDKKTDFLEQLTILFKTRLLQTDTMIAGICKSPFNLSANDQLTAREDTSYPANIVASRSKIARRLKLAVLNDLLDYSDIIDSVPLTKQKTFIDSMEVVLRKKVATTSRRSINRLINSPGGLAEEVGSIYCKALANCFDPHTDYFRQTDKENFVGMLGGDHYEFGFEIDDSGEEGVEIGSLKPGGAAFKSGLLNKGDKIQSVKWEGQKPIDVSDATAEEVGRILSESNHERMSVAVKKADGSIREITLQKEKSTEEDSDGDRVRSFLLKGNKTIGFISLPAFYTDWTDDENNGCANDVAKEIVKLKKENIDGLILDVRYNGGGSMQEAIDMSGIFIDAGPVAQIKGSEQKVITLKDVNRGTIYDGPLVLMVNGYSASASEMIAGTLQDYNRAIIVGTPTYGKATAQVVLPLDTTIDISSYKPSAKTNTAFIKVTTGRLYRVNGQTAQGKGVIPDVIVPDLSDAEQRREATAKNALAASSIETNKYYKPYPSITTDELKSYAAATIDSSSYFKSLATYIKIYKQLQQPHDESLNWNDKLKEQKQLEKLFAEFDKNKTGDKDVFTVANNAYERQRLSTNIEFKQINEEITKYLLDDAQLKIAYQLACQLVK